MQSPSFFYLLFRLDATRHLELVLKASLQLELHQVLQCLVYRDQLSLGLCALVVSVSNVDSARLGLLGTDNCISKLVAVK